MAVIKRNPHTEKARDLWYEVQNKMCFLLAHTTYHGEHVDFLNYALEAFRDHLKLYTFSFCKPCRNCGRPTNDILGCASKNFESPCSPVDEEYDFDKYFEGVDSRPSHLVPKLTVEDLERMKKEKP